MEPDYQKIDFDLPKNQSNVIKVVGVGGGGSNAVNYMYHLGIKGVDFVACNTDAQALQNSPVPNKIQLGVSLTEGLGAGANPEIGERSAIESVDELSRMLSTNTKMIFITAGMGGGTGTGAAPVIAKMAQDMGVLTVGIVTMPFQFEGKTRNDQAEIGLEKLRKYVDSIIVINNNKLREVYGDLGFKQGFAKADEVLANASRGIAEVITHHYTQNIDLRDAKTVLASSGTAIMGSATAKGQNRGETAVAKALDSPLLNDNKIIGAKNVLLLVVSGTDEVTIDEIGTINEHIQREAGNNANIIMGIGEDSSLGEAIAVTVIATGFDLEQQEEIVHADPKKIIHSLSDEQPIVHTLESEPAETDLFSEVSPLVAADQKEEELVETTELIRSIEVQHEEVIEEPVNEPIANHDEFIIHELPTQVHDMQVVDHEEVVAHHEEYENPIPDEQPMKEVAPILFHLEEEPQVQNEAEQPVVASIDIEQKEPIPTVKKYNLEDFIEPVAESSPVKEEAVLKQADEVKKEEPVNADEEEEVNPLNSTITQGLAQRADERRKKLKSFNHKFVTNRIDELEREPAYKRAQVDVNGEQNLSRMSVDMDTNDEIRLRTNNSFLHDNVD
ncbi:MAG: cell division protein FtsZ [Flavobacteriaceae bacterium]|jgi:cell division protein FtsZ|nr:cell division protein FtsZ [Flavobacteriaceae bacterium]